MSYVQQQEGNGVQAEVSNRQWPVVNWLHTVCCGKSEIHKGDMKNTSRSLPKFALTCVVYLLTFVACVMTT